MMNSNRLLGFPIVLAFVSLTSSLCTFASDPVRAKVVCFGDSITKRGYSDILAPLLGVDAINAGVGGNTTTQALRRMDQDVFSEHPDVVVIFFGTNDSRVDNAKVHVPLDRYSANLHEMIDACQKQQAQVVLCTVPPINHEPYFTRHDKAVFERAGGLDRLLQQYREAVLQVARERKVAVVDLNQILLDEPNWLSPDGVHPSTEGVAILAKHIGKAIRPLIATNEERR
ncbi:secreted protein containing Lipase, GDSL domain protein [Rhodopirellula maiorica SM1]|uniref:Secreted protein containing Lipase, GDSL domain protein n=1 Tax=Rhodopirellula maiorica SM1 TaxID=1265738 RepID=M5RHL3_9BACT|nr:GDSL-type esterase/lipase family protein [Rhodopirellula maiorica]EMI18691.1 secreted protein containing Lipase, GDSL domain protein [Rhodopirellula maiorica SM1]